MRKFPLFRHREHSGAIQERHSRRPGWLHRLAPRDDERGGALPAALACLALLAASGCVQKIAEHRVRSALLDAGLSERNADCMAHRMVDRLTIRQLRKLEALKGEKRSLADYVIAVRRVHDSEAVAVTVSAAALCATGLAR